MGHPGLHHTSNEQFLPYTFDIFPTVFMGGKKPNCRLSDANIDDLSLQFREVFVLWDGAFFLARAIDPTEMDTTIYQMYVDAAVNRITHMVADMQQFL